jgi:hypothetical protein
MTTETKALETAELERLMSEAIERNDVIAVVSASEEEGDLGVWISGPQGRMEEFLIAEDTRHGKKGYRVLRYTPPAGVKADDERSLTWDWDEWYQFYETLDAVALALKSGDYRAGWAAF